MNNITYTRFIVSRGKIRTATMEERNGTLTLLSQSEPVMHTKRIYNEDIEVHVSYIFGDMIDDVR